MKIKNFHKIEDTVKYLSNIMLIESDEDQLCLLSAIVSILSDILESEKEN